LCVRSATDRRRGPFFVHCAEGENRTSTAIAVYRIAVQGWRPGEAVDEAADGGFGFAAGSKAELAEYMRKLDIEKLKALAGRPSASTAAD
jgi:protein tyrosine/serine phosphatase